MGQDGKLTRMPFLVAEEINRRLFDNVPQNAIVEWVNSHPPAVEALKAYFDGRPVTAQNLSDYKHGKKYTEWCRKRAALEAVQEKTKFAVGLAQEAGMDLSDAGDAIMTSRLLEALEDLDNTDEDQHAKLVALTEVFARLRASSVSRGSLAVRQRELEGRTKKLELAEKQLQQTTVKAFMKWAQSKEAAAIIQSGKPQHIQMDLLHDLMFGKRPDPASS